VSSAADHVCVLGLGGVGGSLAVRLARAGIEVICVARPQAVVTLTAAGLSLFDDEESYTAHPCFTDHLSEPVDLLLVAVKAAELEVALERIDPDAVANGVVLPLLNGLEHMVVLRRRFGKRVAAGSTSVIACKEAPGKIVQESSFTIVRMASDDLERDELERAAELLQRAGVDVRVVDSELDVLWGKAVRMGPLAAVTAASGMTLGEILADSAWRRRLDAALKESYATATAAGMPMDFAEQWGWVEALPGSFTSSTARDAAAGRRSEIDAIAGSIVREGARLGVSTPALAALVAEVEAITAANSKKED